MNALRPGFTLRTSWNAKSSGRVQTRIPLLRLLRGRALHSNYSQSQRHGLSLVTSQSATFAQHIEQVLEKALFTRALVVKTVLGEHHLLQTLIVG